MSTVKDVSEIPKKGKGLVIVAAVDHRLHFRIFNHNGSMVVDTDEVKLSDRAKQVDDLRKQLVDVWSPHALSANDKDRLLSVVASTVGYTPSNFYYWYYATLALFQHGGEPWSHWNAWTRDRIVGLQLTEGHRAGSWDPDDSLYGAKGGRIYCTALAALTLEVYYRYLRLYDEPRLPLEAGEPPGLAPPRREPAAAAFNPEDQ